MNTLYAALVSLWLSVMEPVVTLNSWHTQALAAFGAF